MVEPREWGGGMITLISASLFEMVASAELMSRRPKTVDSPWSTTFGDCRVESTVRENTCR